MQVPAKLKRFTRQHTRHCELPFPASANLRIAQVTTSSPFEGVAAFSPERWHELETYRPQILVGPAAELQKLGEQVGSGTVNLRTVDHAVFVLTECGGRPLSETFRVVLWQTFGVPVYELFVGMRDVLLACECEAHEGWHVQSYPSFWLSHGELLIDALGQKAVHTGLMAYLESSGCPCGRPGPRLMGIEACGPGKAQHELAATA
jgi:hypothetical protein